MTPFKRNIPLIYITSFLGGLEFALPIKVLYLQQELLTIFYVTLVLAIKTGATFALELPTGIITDRWGRKLSLLLSSIFGILSLICYLIGQYLLIFLLAAVCSAIAQTTASGTSTSLVYESLAQIQGKYTSFKRVQSINYAMWPIGASIASVVGSYIGAINYRLPFLLMLFPSTIVLLLRFKLVEPQTSENHVNDPDSRPTISDTCRNSINLLRSNRQVRIIILIGVFSYIGEISHQLKPVYFQFKGIAISYFGYLYALAFIAVFAGSVLSDPLSKRMTERHLLISCAVFSQIVTMSSILTTGLLSGLFLICSSFSWGVTWPVLSDLLNNELEGNNRTTILSFDNMMKMLIFAILSPVYGYLVDQFNILQLYLLDWIIAGVLILPLFWIRNEQSAADPGVSSYI